MRADTSGPEIADVSESAAHADGVIIGTPIYKAAYSGLLKALLDLLPQAAFAGKTVLPLATGGTPTDVLAIDYAMRPVLSSMGADHTVQGWFVLDRHITLRSDDVSVAPDAQDALYKVVDQFSKASRSLLAEFVARVWKQIPLEGLTDSGAWPRPPRSTGRS